MMLRRQHTQRCNSPVDCQSGVVLVEWRTMLLDTVVERASTLLEINAVRGAAPDKTKTARQLVKRGLIGVLFTLSKLIPGFSDLILNTWVKCQVTLVNTVSPPCLCDSPSLVGALISPGSIPNLPSPIAEFCFSVAPHAHSSSDQKLSIMTVASSIFTLLLLLAILAMQASASGSGSLGASVEFQTEATVNSTTTASSSSTSSSNSTEVTLAPINTPSSTSTTFQLVDNIDCNSTVSSMIYVIYNKNRALFDLCVSDAQYQIFPFLGTEPSAAQVQAMATSTSCDVVFTGVLLASFPQCTISGFPFKAAVETLLKIHVDLVYGYAPSPSAERFQEMMSWRRYVNLAKGAGVPCDSDSELYAEYEENLSVARSNSSIRVLSNYQIEYKLASGSWYDADGEDYTTIGSDSDEDTADKVSTGDGNSQASDSEASNVEENSTAAGSPAPSIIVTLASLLISALLVTT
ncbi:hypothetical protein PC116_g623 [Phytophthora cactorum]|nr:hypothetical protein PC116_g623 [Phytophthora cactorum]